AALSLPAQRDLWRVSHQWEARRHAAEVRGLGVLKDAIDAAVTRSIASAQAALNVSRDRTRAFEELGRLTGSRDETGIVLYRGDSAFAWSGEVRPTIDL